MLMLFPFKLPQQKPFDAVGFGLNAIDYIVVVPHYPAIDSKTRFLEYRLCPGGQTATAMIALQRLGLKTAYAGRFGSDSAGELGIASIKGEGINLDYAEVIEGSNTQTAFIIVDVRTGERTIIWDRDPNLCYQPGEAPLPFATLGRVLHLDAHDPLAGMNLAQVASKSGIIVSADIDNIYDGLPQLLPLIDILITSKEFPERLLGIRDLRSALVELKARYGCSIVGATLGSGGATLYGEGQFVDSPAFDVPGGCRDTTGAGDAFHGGFLYGLLTGRDVETSLLLANATAALKCRHLGARTALPSRFELENFLAHGK